MIKLKIVSWHCPTESQLAHLALW